jgi:hypothetical protein
MKRPGEESAISGGGAITRSSASASGGLGRTLGRGFERGQGARDDLAAWQAYVRNGGHLSFQAWKAQGRPTDFRFGGYVNPSTSFGHNTGSSGYPGSPRFNSGQTVTVRDDATASEVRGLRDDIRRNGGFL